MTRSGATGPNADESEGEELEDAAPLNELSSSPLPEDDDGPPLLPQLDAEAGPARPLAERELLLLADRIERQFAQRRRPVSWLAPRRLLLAGGLFAASAAAAVLGVNVVRRSAPPAAVTSPAEPPVVEPARSPPGAAEPSGVEERPAELPPGKEPEKEPQKEEEETVAPRAPRTGATGHQNDRPRGTVAADRLAAANSLRSRHRYREALALYLEVIEIAPNGMQAGVARVAAAEMLLEHVGDVAGAERLYREARTQGGELTAEAQFGLSQVARARADAPGERRALQDFLTRHPESPLAAAARRRLSTLGVR
ncbi:MAG: hypothetical protein ABI895_03945 [Deltaproteobacteria bacterium]